MKTRAKYVIITILVCFAVMFSRHLFAKEYVPALPSNNIYDPRNYLTNISEDRLRSHNEKSDTQISVYVSESLYGENMNSFAEEVLKVWSQTKKKDAKLIVVVVSIDDHHAAIATSESLASSLSKLDKSDIIDELGKNMRRKRYDSMILEMIDQVESAHDSRSKTQPEDNARRKFQIADTLVQIFHYTVLVVAIILFVRKLVGPKVKHPHRGQFEYSPVTNRWSLNRVPVVPDDWSFKEHVRTLDEREVR